MKPTKELHSVLILDDDTIQARVLSVKLSSLGYEIAAVTFTATEAIIQTEKKQPDIVLLDINLNGQATNGIEVGKSIRRINKNIIIIYITAYASNKNFEQALSSVPSAFISKPYDMRTLDININLAINQIVQSDPEAPTSEEKEPLPNDFKILCFPDRLKIKKDGTYIDWFIHDIQYWEADGAYTKLNTSSRRQQLTIGLGKIEKKLLNYPYLMMVRIHHKYLINIEHIETLKVSPKTGGTLTMANGQELKVSRGYAEEFWKRYFDHFG